MESLPLNDYTQPIYIIINPNHSLGPMVATWDDPLGYRDPVEAVSELGQMRKEFGTHLVLCRVVPVREPVAGRSELKRFNDDNWVEEFPYPLVEEYLK